MIEQPDDNIHLLSTGGWFNLWNELPRLSVLIMELCWMVPWFQLITLAVKDTPPGRIALVFSVLVMLAYLMVRTIFHLSLKENIRRGIFIGFIILSAILSMWIILYNQHQATDLWALYNQPLDSMNDFRELIPPEAMVIFFVLFLTRRGFALARDWGGANSVINSIQTSIVAFVIYGALGRESADDVITANLFVFLLAAIFGMVTARIGSIRLQRGGRGVRFNLRWLGSILSTTVIITGIAAAVAVFSASQVERMKQLLRVVFYSAFFFIATPFFTLVSRLFPALESLQDALQTAEAEQNVPEWELENSTSPQGYPLEDTLGSGVEFLLQLRFIVLVILIIVATILIIRMVLRQQSRNVTGTDDERQSLLEGRGIFKFLLDLLRLQAKQTAESLANAARLNRREKMRAAARIRRIYADLMELCDDLGHARTLSQTPQEFLPKVVYLFPQNSNELYQITDSYQRVRYGELPEIRQEVEDVEFAWKQIQAKGEILKKNLQLSK
jgi:hypothetical protein